MLNYLNERNDRDRMRVFVGKCRFRAFDKEKIHPPRILKVSCGAIAQLGERVTGSHEVRGSIPRSSTNYSRLNSLTYLKNKLF